MTHYGGRVRIAHLTDPHIRHFQPGSSALPNRRSRYAVDLMRQAIADAKERGADVVAVTGDILDVPKYLFDQDRQQWKDGDLWDAVRRDYRLLKEILDEGGLPWVAVPGNHDAYYAMDEEMGPLPRVVEHEGVRFVAFWDRERPDHVPQRILDERRRFDSMMLDPDPTPQVHLQHFVITPDLNTWYPHTYLEGEELRSRLAAAGKLVVALSGHYHPGMPPEQDGDAWFSIGAALCESPHTYRLVDIDPATGDVAFETIALEADPEPVPAVFLDRDGCINTLASYNAGPGPMELIPGSAAAIRRLRAAGYRVVVVTNQSCVGLGYVTEGVLEEVHDEMARLLALEGAEVDAIYASFEAGECGIAPEYRTTDLLKPSPAMLKLAAKDHHLDLSRSFLVGDRATDVEAARGAGVVPALVRTGDGRLTEAAWEGEPVEVFDNLAAAADWILGR